MQTGCRLLEEMSDDGVREDDEFDREREGMHKKSKKNNKTNEHKSESEATSQRTSPRKGRTECPVSPLRRSFWVTCGVKMMTLPHSWGWQPPQTASCIHLRHIWSVWAHWYAAHRHMGAALHSYTHTTWLKLRGFLGHMWSRNDVITSWLRLTATSNCFP